MMVLNNPGIAIIGAGLIGRKRAQILNPGQLKVVCDLDMSKAEKLAVDFSPAIPMIDVEQAVNYPGVDAVFIATTNSTLAPLSEIALRSGKHVLVEKPAAISVKELEHLERVCRENNCLLRVGYNHRYHPAFIKARALLEENVLGPLMFIRGRYGHGGRLGYDREWRACPELSGGGELIDQGVHLIDLAAWFLGEFTEVRGSALTYFWDMPVDDNAFIHLETKDRQTAWLHVSCTEWKNLFSFEIYGKNAKLHIEGLGGSYGIERLYFYRMLPEMGPPETTVFEFPRGDDSWRLETKEFMEDIRLLRVPVPGLKEAKTALKIVEQIVSNEQQRKRG